MFPKRPALHSRCMDGFESTSLSCPRQTTRKTYPPNSSYFRDSCSGTVDWLISKSLMKLSGRKAPALTTIFHQTTTLPARRMSFPHSQCETNLQGYTNLPYPSPPLVQSDPPPLLWVSNKNNAVRQMNGPWGQKTVKHR